jgi:hypothetical protein
MEYIISKDFSKVYLTCCGHPKGARLVAIYQRRSDTQQLHSPFDGGTLPSTDINGR